MRYLQEEQVVAATDSFQDGLKAVERLMNNEIRFKSAELGDIIEFRMNNLDRRLSPALVLAVSCIAGPLNKTSLSLAAIFQYLFLAHNIHNLISDEDMLDSERQYPVLIGDYMLGQSFAKICEGDLFPHLKHFTQLVKSINEAKIKRWQIKNKKASLKEYKVIISRERASLTSLAARLAAEVSGIHRQHIASLEEFGYNVGMVWASWEEPIYGFLAQEYLARAKADIAELREKLIIRPLQELYDFLYTEIIKKPALVSIN